MNSNLKSISILLLMSTSFMTAAVDQFNREFMQPISPKYGARQGHLTTSYLPVNQLPNSTTEQPISTSLFKNKLNPRKDIVEATLQRNSFILLSPGRYELNLQDVEYGVNIGGIIRKEGKIRSTKFGDSFIFEWIRNDIQILRLHSIIGENSKLYFDRFLEDKPKPGETKRLPKFVSWRTLTSPVVDDITVLDPSAFNRMADQEWQGVLKADKRGDKQVTIRLFNSSRTVTSKNTNNIQPEQQMSARYYANLANDYFRSNDLVTACRNYEIALALDLSVLGEIDLQNLREIRAHFWGLAVKKSNDDKNANSEEFNQECLDLFSLCMSSQKCFIALKGKKSTTDDYMFLADASYFSKHYTVALNYLKKSVRISPSRRGKVGRRQAY